MAAPQVLRLTNWLRATWSLNPLRGLWWLFSNVRWAIALIAFIALVSLAGVLLPQVLPPVRDDPVQLAQWLEFQRGRYGIFTDFMYRLGLFDVFHTLWFAASLGLLVVSVIVSSVARYPAILRTVRRPPKRVPDAYFQRTHDGLELPKAADVGRLQSVLRRHRYTVKRSQEGETTYLFADRFQWAQLGTLVSHLSIVLLIAGALVSYFTGFSQPVAIAEGTSAPVLPVGHASQMQVRVLDAVGSFDERGQPIDYHTDMTIFREGDEVKRCTITVNSPCKYGGYRFHQSAYFGNGAEVQVRDVNTGNVVYREVLALLDEVPGPRVIIRDSSDKVLFDETITPADIVETAYGRKVVLAGDERPLWIGVRPDESGEDWSLVIFELSDREDAVGLLIANGDRARAGGLDFEFLGVTGIPASLESDFPSPAGAEPAGGSGPVILQLANVVYGSSEASAGGNVDVPEVKGPPTLSIIGSDSPAMNLTPGQSQTIGNYEYTFLGQREFAGIQVKKDRGDIVIWMGVGLLMTGMLITFWVPRRRLWVKITADRTYLAGKANHLANFKNEMRHLAEEAGATDESEDRAE